jgi:hypothetical protein
MAYAPDTPCHCMLENHRHCIHGHAADCPEPGECELLDNDRDQGTKGLISDAQARSIASAYHGGQFSALYSLSSTGAIDVERVTSEVSTAVQELEPGPDRRPLLALDKYVRTHGTRGPVPGWSKLWDDDEPTADQC